MKYIIKNEGEPDKLKIDYKAALNEEQLRVVTSQESKSLVLAGAGSGKTRTLVFRVLYLLESGVKPENILLVTFTNKAAKEMMTRIKSMLGAQPKKLFGGTFHHIGNRLLRMYGNNIGIKSNFVILDSEDSKTMIKHCINEIHPASDKYFPKPNLIAAICSLSINLNKPIEQLINDRYRSLDAAYVPIISRIASRYREKKQLANALDYDDLLLKWKELLENSPEVREKLRLKFRYILVDEYQDTNFIQNAIINLLSSKETSVLAVGDDSQSIYNFRGADVNNILNFPKLFPEAKIYKLETNYRSTPEILALANESIKNNSSQFSKSLKAVKESSKKPVLAPVTDLDQQADFVNQRILDLQREGMNLSDMAVLFRSHFQSLEMEMGFNKRNIPYEMRGGMRFFEQAHIKDAVAYLRIKDNPEDELSWFRILTLQPSIGPASAAKIFEALRSLNGLKAMAQAELGFLSPKIRVSWQKLSATLVKIDYYGEDQSAEVVREVLNSGYQSYLKNQFENSEDRIEDLRQLAEFASTYDSLSRLLSDIALSEGFKGGVVEGEESAPTEAVTLSTIHQAKGLEWKVVFVIGLSEGQFPHARSYESDYEMQEERRLFYVATTRAMDSLYLSYPMIGRGDVFARPSQFIQELPLALYDKWDIEDEVTYDYDEDKPRKKILNFDW